MTIVEVVVSSLILTTIVLVVSSTVLDSQAFFAEEARLYSLDQSGRALLARVEQEIRASAASSILPLAISDSSFLDYQKAAGVNADGTIALGPLLRFSFELVPGEIADSVDNNGDGLIDEGTISWRDESGTARAIAANALGMRVNRAGSALHVDIDLAARQSDGRLVQRTYGQTVAPRN